MVNYNMLMERERCQNGPFGDVFERFRRGVAIENLDPGDKSLVSKLMKMVIPGIVPEHTARYQMAARLAKEIGINKSSVIVDAACGRGYGLPILQQTGARVFGVELGKEYAVATKNNYVDPDPKAGQMGVGNVIQMPIGTEIADMATAFEILEHLPRKHQSVFLREIDRILKPNGVAVISFPERYSFGEKDGKLARAGVASNPHHLYEPTVEEVTQMIAGTSLGIVDELGQLVVDEKEALHVKKIARYLPIWPFYVWGIKREVKPQKMDYTKQETKGQNKRIALTHIFILQKTVKAV